MKAWQAFAIVMSLACGLSWMAFVVYAILNPRVLGPL
jgi:hypothetical protein